MDEDTPFAGDQPKSSTAILAQLKKAEHEFQEWNTTCDVIDQVYGREGRYLSVYGDGGTSWRDGQLDLFWASMEVLKPAVYARPPKPAVKAMFTDGDKVKNTTAEVLERVVASDFYQESIDEVMCELRDDVLFAGRGVAWLIYESDEKGQRVCVEHVDRLDYRHEPARKWAEVGWVAKRSWLTKRDMRKRFGPTSGDLYKQATYTLKRDDEQEPYAQSLTRKAGVWEVWHKADNKVYWVTEGVDKLLDEGKPHYDLSSFWPCPRPAFATKRRRSLVPVPDWERYAVHFRKISDLTSRIYVLLDSVRMKGLIPGDGEVGDSIEQLFRSDDDSLLIPVPGAALLAGSSTGFVQWMPLQELAAAIQGLIEARGQLIEDFYQLSGISDIMRGATEADETLGAQQLKSHYGSVRVQEKVRELQRIAADCIKIAAEMAAEHFSNKTILEMSQMDLPKKSEIKARIKEIEDAAAKEMEALGQKAQQAMQQGQEVDLAQAQQMLEQAQQQIIQKYAGMLSEVEQKVSIEAVMELLRDDKARSFAFEVESDSTILTDEMSEKQARGEFLQQFSGAAANLTQFASMGEQGAILAGELMKFTLAPYRAGRQLDGAIDAFIEAAPEMAAAMGAGEDDQGLAEANNKLAEAEMAKAQAAQSKVEADSQLKQAEMQRKAVEMQIKQAQDQQKYELEIAKLQQAAQDSAVKAEEALAKVDLIKAQTIKALADAGVTVDAQALDEFKSLADIEFRQADAARQDEQQALDNTLRVEDSQRSAIESERTNQRADRSEDRADRQQEFTERQPPKGAQ